MDVTVVGAGVIGLSTALVLEAQGHAVHIVATARDQATTSAIAGAIWFPYRAGPPDKVAGWAARTHGWLAEIAARDPSAGVDPLVGYEITNEPPDAPAPWWAAGITVDRVPAPVAGAPLAWRFAAPRVEPARFLPWLAAQLRATIELRTVTALGELPGDVVVDCAGLGARALAGDAALVPLLGQIVIAAPGTVDLGVTITDDRDPDAVFYVIPRRDEVVLGGCTLAWDPDVVPAIDPTITARILAHAARLGIAVGAIRRERVGLRPARPEVRLARDPDDARIIHNYGHGGAGFTLCRGCAEDVGYLITPA